MIRSMAGARWLASAMIVAIVLLAGCERVVLAQDARVNLYRYVLGVDVPEPAAFVVMGVSPSQVVLGSAPKPVAGSAIATFGPTGETAPGLAIDVAPYYLVGGGVRDLESYRSNSFLGRAARVLTKSLLSIGVVRPAEDPSAPFVAIGIRSTFHDPHDPVLNTTLPEDVTAELAAADVELPDDAVETLNDRGVDLSPIFADARQRMRARAGDAQISGGWGVTARAHDGVVDGDGLGKPRHTFWASAQYTASARFDLLANIQFRNAFRDDDRFWLGGALRRKGPRADLQAGFYYDTESEELNPGLALDARLSQNLGIVASITTQRDLPDFSGERRIRFALLGRWFAASDRVSR